MALAERTHLIDRAYLKALLWLMLLFFFPFVVTLIIVRYILDLTTCTGTVL